MKTYTSVSQGSGREEKTTEDEPGGIDVRIEISRSLTPPDRLATLTNCIHISWRGSGRISAFKSLRNPAVSHPQNHWQTLLPKQQNSTSCVIKYVHIYQQ